MGFNSSLPPTCLGLKGLVIIVVVVVVVVVAEEVLLNI
jgi:hypothetical protein